MSGDKLPFFVAYANNSIIDHQNISSIFQSLQNNLPLKPPALKTIFQEIELFLEMTHEEAKRICSDKVKMTADNLPQTFIDLLCIVNAYYACYGYAEIGCGLNCERWTERIKKAGRKMTLRTAHRLKKRLPVEGDLKWKCIECQQRYFIFLLDEIVNGRSYEEIEGFQNFLDAANKVNRWAYVVKNHEVIIEPTWGVEDNSFIPLSIGCSTWPIFDKKNINPFAFQDFMDMILAYDLIRFLNKTGRGKLRKCDYCKNFYVTNKIDRRNLFCADSCRHASTRAKKNKEDHALYQRNYRATVRDRKKKREEKKIEQYMKKGYTRSEAITEIRGKS